MNESKPVDILGYLWGLRKVAVWGLLVAVLAGVAGLLVTRPESTASVKAIALLVGEPPAAADQAQVQRMNAFYPWTMLSYARLATTDEVLAPVAKKHNTNVAAMQSLIGARLVPSSMLLEVRYTGTSADDATSTLNDIAAALEAESTKAEYNVAGAPVTLVVTQPATVNVEPNLNTEADAAATSNSSKSTVIRLVIVGGVALALGLITTFGLAAVLGRRRRSAA